eukprot:330049-Pelagomonas_calceolata.AAC.1
MLFTCGSFLRAIAVGAHAQQTVVSLEEAANPWVAASSKPQTPCNEVQLEGVGRCLVEGVGRCLVEDCHNAVCVSANGS